MIIKYIKKNLLRISIILYDFIRIFSIIYFWINSIELLNIMSNRYVLPEDTGTCKITNPLIFDRIGKGYYLETECFFEKRNITNRLCHLNSKIEQLGSNEYVCYLCNKIPEIDIINNKTVSEIIYVSLFDCEIGYKVIIFVLKNILIPAISKLIISINYKTIANDIILKNLILEEGILLEEDERCIICLCQFNVFEEENNINQKVIKTNCRTSHYYCYGCIKKWTKNNNTCPYCRTRIVL